MFDRSPAGSLAFVVCSFGILSTVIGILGGTFDPPHIAHLAVAHAAFDQLSLTDVLLMPAGDPWQKSDGDPSSATDRLAMADLAAAEAPYLAADDREVVRDGPTFTIDTVATLEPDAVIILGADAAVGVASWHRADELIGSAHFAVVPRAGIDRSQVSDVLGTAIEWLDLPPIDISSSDVRTHVAAGNSARFLVPASVADFIEERGLYRFATWPALHSVPIIDVDE